MSILASIRSWQRRRVWRISRKAELLQTRSVISQRLEQTVRVYLREYSSPVPDTWLRHNDRLTMAQHLKELEEIDKELRFLDRPTRKATAAGNTGRGD